MDLFMYFIMKTDFFRKTLFCTCVLTTLNAVTVNADDQSDRVQIGVWGGAHLGSAKFSNLDDGLFPDVKGVTSSVFGAFAKFDLDRSRTFALRPELMFLKRGTRIENISYKPGTGTGQLNYELNANYVDIRVPIMVQFGAVGGVRPYVYVAPVLGFATGGKISAEDDRSRLEMEVSKANIASTYFAGALGAGVNIPVNIGNGKYFNIGIDASYEVGFSDTYGSKEKDGKAIANGFFPVYDIQGTRKFSGFELKASVAVPLSIFKRTGKKTVRIYDDTPPAVSKPVTVREKPCYTLDEILEMVQRNENVSGKKICAIDVINFEFNKSTLTSKSRVYLNKIVQLMKNTGLKFIVRGHTDNVGSAEYNLNLSKKRAKAVYDYLLSKGVNSNKISYTYHGLTEPIDTNDTEEGRRNNRRVEFDIY